MLLRNEIKAAAPRLRRYARGLLNGNAAPCERADDLVRRTLTAALDERRAVSGHELVVRLFAILTDVNRADQTAPARPSARQPILAAIGSRALSLPETTRLSVGLATMPLDQREVLLLVTVEGFGYGEAARILRLTRATLMHRLTCAREALDNALEQRPMPARMGDMRPRLRLVT